MRLCVRTPRVRALWTCNIWFVIFILSESSAVFAQTVDSSQDWNAVAKPAELSTKSMFLQMQHVLALASGEKAPPQKSADQKSHGVNQPAPEEASMGLMFRQMQNVLSLASGRKRVLAPARNHPAETFNHVATKAHEPEASSTGAMFKQMQKVLELAGGGKRTDVKSPSQRQTLGKEGMTLRTARPQASSDLPPVRSQRSQFSTPSSTATMYEKQHQLARATKSPDAEAFILGGMKHPEPTNKHLVSGPRTGVRDSGLPKSVVEDNFSQWQPYLNLSGWERTWQAPSLRDLENGTLSMPNFMWNSFRDHWNGGSTQMKAHKPDIRPGPTDWKAELNNWVAGIAGSTGRAMPVTGTNSNGAEAHGSSAQPAARALPAMPGRGKTEAAWTPVGTWITSAQNWMHGLFTHSRPLHREQPAAPTPLRPPAGSPAAAHDTTATADAPMPSPPAPRSPRSQYALPAWSVAPSAGHAADDSGLYRARSSSEGGSGSNSGSEQAWVQAQHAAVEAARAKEKRFEAAARQEARKAAAEEKVLLAELGQPASEAVTRRGGESHAGGGILGGAADSEASPHSNQGHADGIVTRDGRGDPPVPLPSPSGDGGGAVVEMPVQQVGSNLKAVTRGRQGTVRPGAQLAKSAPLTKRAPAEGPGSRLHRARAVQEGAGGLKALFADESRLLTKSLDQSMKE